ncbi:MAG: hypothetical protein BroJett011_30060 [Chloroflexota bacterium]|nr:MAG: hypothetical protein BroJett011_30060 [Chloroflexota bacterium]
MLFAAVFILAALPRLISLNAFLAHDETQYWAWSHDFFLALLQGNWPGTIVGPGNPSITIFLSHSLVMGLKYAWAWVNGLQAATLSTWPDFQLEPVLDLLMQRRWPIVLFNTLAVALAYRLVERLSGRWVALAAAVLLAFDPFYLADSRTSRGEGLMASLTLLTILAYLNYWIYRRRRYLIFSGIVAGLALLTKISAVSLFIWTVLALLLLAQRNWGELKKTTASTDAPPIAFFQQPFRRMLGTWLGWALLAIATFWLLWPAMWVSPLQALRYMGNFVAEVGVSGRQNYFFGQVYTDEWLPLFYPVVFILRVTPLVCLGLIANLVYLWQTLARRRKGDDSALNGPERLQLVLAGLLWLFVLIYGALMTVGTLKRDWYILPIFPTLDIIAAMGLVWLGQRLWQRPVIPPISAAAAAWLGVTAILVLQMATTLPSYPYYYTYWNPLVLGDRWAADAVRIGWDLDLSAGADYLNRKADAEKLKVATRSTRGFTQIFKGQTIRWVSEQPWIQANYLLVRRNHLQREKLEPYQLDYLTHLKLEHVVNLDGVDYLWIYQGPRAQYFAGPSTLAGKAILMGYDVNSPEVILGNTLPVKFYWQNQGMTPADNFFLQLVDANEYVWAETHAAPLPGFEEAALVPYQIVESKADLRIPVGTPPGTYFLRSGVYNQARQENLGYFTLAGGGDKVTVARPATPLSATDLTLTHRVGQAIAPQLTLLGFNMPDETLFLTRPNWLTLYWQAGQTPKQDYVIAMQLLDQQEQEAAYWLGRPVFSGYPTTQWTAGEIVGDPWRLELPANLVPGDYTLQTTVFDAETQAQVGQMKLGALTVSQRPQRFDLPLLPHSINAQLGDEITLLGYDLTTEPIMGGGRLRLMLYWQANQVVAASYTVFVHLLNANGQVVAQHDGLPAEGTIPTPGWAAGEVIADRHLIDFPDLPAGDYRLVAGMYDPATGERLATSNGETAISLQVVPLD